jgi:outer membrane protein assembly factor BamD
VKVAARPAPLVTASLLILALACTSAPPPPEFAEAASAEDLYAQGLAELDDGGMILFFDTTDYAEAIEHFQDIIDNYPYSEYAVLAELKIADAYFAQESYEEALSYYRDFSELHPEHAQVPYTIYRAALCHYEQARDPERDQTATKQALSFLDRLLQEHPYSAEAKEGEVLWRELRTRLAAHAMGIGDFYMEREEFQSAADRYRSVLNEYPGLGLDAQALYKLGVCYNRMNLEDRATQIFQVILENYRGSEVAEAAAEMIPAAN